MHTWIGFGDSAGDPLVSESENGGDVDGSFTAASSSDPEPVTGLSSINEPDQSSPEINPVPPGFVPEVDDSFTDALVALWESYTVQEFVIDIAVVTAIIAVDVFVVTPLIPDISVTLSAASVFGRRAASKVLQSGGNSITNRTARGLNQEFGTSLSKGEWGKALERLKEFEILPNNHHGKIMRNGDYLDDAGTKFGNLGDYLQ